MLNKIKKTIETKEKNILKILNINKKYTIKFIKRNTNHLVSIYDNDKLLLNGEYEFYGIYQINTKLWIWASSIPNININHIKNVNKIRKFSYLFESNNDKINTFYYQLLTQDVIYINNINKLKLIKDLLLYLTDNIYIFNPINSENNIQFILLKNIKEKYI
jgi:hypothetical protein